MGHENPVQRERRLLSEAESALDAYDGRDELKRRRLATSVAARRARLKRLQREQRQEALFAELR